MMSKERELLERWVDDRILEPEELDSLMKETKELLAQPEQTEQAPTTLSDKERQEAATEHRLKSMRGG